MFFSTKGGNPSRTSDIITENSKWVKFFSVTNWHEDSDRGVQSCGGDRGGDQEVQIRQGESGRADPELPWRHLKVEEAFLSNAVLMAEELDSVTRDR